MRASSSSSGDEAVLVGLELVVVVVVVQGDARGVELGLHLLHPLDKGVNLSLGGKALVGDNQVLAANGLVIGNGLLELIAGQLAHAGVGAGGRQAVLIQPAFDLLGAVAEKAGELHRAVAHLRHLAQGAFHVPLCHVAHAEQLQTVFHFDTLLSQRRGGAFFRYHTKGAGKSQGLFGALFPGRGGRATP